MKPFCLILFFISLTWFSFAQEAETDSAQSLQFSAAGDFVSRYVWRGSDYGNSPAIQPSLEMSYGRFTAGAWGSTSLASLSIQEVDLYAGFSLWKLKFTCWDYFYMNMDTSNNSYGKYSKGSTAHDLSMDAEFLLSEKRPLKILVSYNFHGADTLHSAYFEASYKFNRKTPCVIFVGATTGEGWYGTGAGVVNTGIAVNKECKISDDYSVNIYTKIVYNPQRENIHLVAGITF